MLATKITNNIIVFTMTEKLKQEYDAPMVELIEARVEKGFQTSMTEEQMRSSNMEGVTGSGHNYDNALFS